MFSNTITVFNYHKPTDSWYATVFHGVNLSNRSTANATAERGHVNNSSISVTIRVRSGSSSMILDPFGIGGGTIADETKIHYKDKFTPVDKIYVPPKEFEKLSDPNNYFTFKPECDFMMIGDHPIDFPEPDDRGMDGFYNEMNTEHDGVFMISSAEYFTLLPHFEIGGR